jgi:hypothetical protein
LRAKAANLFVSLRAQSSDEMLVALAIVKPHKTYGTRAAAKSGGLRPIFWYFLMAQKVQSK